MAQAARPQPPSQPSQPEPHILTHPAQPNPPSNHQAGLAPLASPAIPLDLVACPNKTWDDSDLYPVRYGTAASDNQCCPSYTAQPSPASPAKRLTTHAHSHSHTDTHTRTLYKDRSDIFAPLLFSFLQLFCSFSVLVPSTLSPSSLRTNPLALPLPFLLPRRSDLIVSRPTPCSFLAIFGQTWQRVAPYFRINQNLGPPGQVILVHHCAAATTITMTMSCDGCCSLHNEPPPCT